MNDSARIEQFTPETISRLQTTFFNRVQQDAHELGIDLKIGNITHDGFHFKTVMEGALVTDEAQKALEKQMKDHLKMHDLKVGDKSVIYNRPWKITGYDPSKYRRTVQLTNDNGKTIFASPEVVHQGIAEFGQLAASKKRGATAPKKERKVRQPRKQKNSSNDTNGQSASA